MKKGIKTSEFWVALAAAILPVVNQYVIGLPVEAILGVVAPMVSYVFSRGWAKSGTTSGPA